MKEIGKNKDFENEHIQDGFAPDGMYLAQLESSLFEKLAVEETFEARKDGFAQDKTSLRSLESKILEAVVVIEQKEAEDGKVIELPSSRKFWVVAASIAVLIALIISIPSNIFQREMQFADLTQESEEWYINQRMPFLTDDDLSLILENEVFDIEIEDEALQQELEDYILQNKLFLNGL